MPKYEILGTIVLGFLTRQDQFDRIIEAGQGHLEFNGADIVWVDPEGQRHESITVNHALTVWTEQGLLRRVDAPA